MIRKLPDHHWHQLEGIFEDEFDSDVPLPENAEILTFSEKGDRIAFINIENVKMIGQIYVYPDYRKDRKAIKAVGRLIKTVRDRAKEGESIITNASDPRFRSLYRKLGMEKISGEIYRINL